MKILRIIGRLNIGGPAIQAVTLSHCLNSRPDVENILVTGSLGPEEGDMSYLAADLGYNPVYVPEIVRHFHPLKDVIAFFKLLILMFRFRPDVIHTHTSKAGFLGRTAGLVYGIWSRCVNDRLNPHYSGHSPVR